MLYHDNSPCHTALSVSEFLPKKNIPVVLQPSNSSDLSPCDYLLFPRLKKHLKGHRFGTIDNITKSVTDQLKEVPVSEIQNCYE